MSASFTTEKASNNQILMIGGLGVVLAAAGFVLWIYASTPMTPSAVFLPIYGTAVFITDLLTGYLFISQFRLTRQLPILFLSAAYLFSGLIVVPQLMVFPGVISPTGLLGAGSQSAVWLWTFWHGGFPILLCLYVLATGYQMRFSGERRLSDRETGLGVWGLLLVIPVLIVGITTLVTSGHDLLPPLIITGDYQSLSNSLWGRGVVVFNLLALVGVIAVTRCRTVGHLGLTLAVLASLIDAILTLAGQARFSLGWYAARMCSLIASGSVLAVFLYEMTWLYDRVLQLNGSLERMAFVDALTGLANRRQFDMRFEAEWSRAQREQTSLSLLMLDVDHFKRFNDRYGHPAGDVCLRQVGDVLAGVIRRPGDLAARYGGEEFAVILPNTDAMGAAALAGKINQAIRALGIPHADGTSAHVVTLSIGIASTRPGQTGDTLTSLKQTADDALYQAKSGGRDCYQIAVANAA